MKQALLAVATTMTLASCTMSVAGPADPLGPMGEAVTITLASGALREGELLAITDADLVLKDASGALAAITLPLLKRVRVNRYEIYVGRRWREDLSLYCRYPQGLTERQWQQLLGQAGQKDFVRATP